MESTADWSLPSESSRVRNLLYLAEGAAIGAGFSVVLVYFFGAGFFLYAIGYEYAAAVGGLVVLGVGLVLIVRWTAVVDRVTHDAPVSAVMRDWQETRDWRWVGLVGLAVGGVNIAVSVALWGVGGTLYFQAPILLAGTALVGIGLHRYVFYRLDTVGHHV